VAYLAATLIVIVGGAIGAGIVIVRHETRPGRRPSFRAARRIVNPTRRAFSGELCLCGGTIGKSGKTSDQFGELLGCTSCDGAWTADGRRIVQRRRDRRQGRSPAPEPTDTATPPLSS
jgi:hypothetical protein